MIRRDRIRLLVFAVAGLPYVPFSEWLSTTRIGTQFFVWGQIVFFLSALLAIPAVPVLIVCLVLKRSRSESLFYLLVAAILIPCTIAGCLLGHKVRSAGMKRFAEHSRTLVAAIEKYEREHSAPPGSLKDLIPDYLPSVPSTGMMAYPEYRYHTGEDARDNYGGNAWALSVFTPSGGINFDQMLYFPNRTYPEHGHGGWLERIGDWAYVHE